MSANYPYYLPLSSSLFESVRFLAITAKMEGLGADQTQKKDKDGTPVWQVSALVKLAGQKQETETFSMSGTIEVASKLNTIEELTPVRLVGLSAGKYVKRGSDKTEWSFLISAVEVIKN